MSQAWVKYKSFYTLLFFLLLSILFMTFLGRNIGERRLLDSVVIEIIAPFHRISNLSSKWINGIWKGYIWLVGAREENSRLKEKINELESLNRQLVEIELENHRLKALLGFRQRLPASIISAQIIGKDATSWFQSILLDKGLDDGVRVNQPVVTHRGLVGKVINATPHASQIELITDKNSRVAAMIQKNRAEAILYGHSSPVCTLEYLDRDVDTMVGDTVITSGMGGIFPKGLMLGVISKIDKQSYGLFQYAEVTLTVPFSKLEEVLVLSIENQETLDEIEITLDIENEYGHNADMPVN